jgi:hypothetical protein
LIDKALGGGGIPDPDKGIGHEIFIGGIAIR